MKRLVLIVMVVLLSTPIALAQGVKSDESFNIEETFWNYPSVWEYTCLLAEDSSSLAELIFGNGGHIALCQEDVYEVQLDVSAYPGKYDCISVGRHSSNVDHGIITFFEFDEYYYEQLVSAEWSFHYKGIIFPFINVGLLNIRSTVTETLNCIMIKKPFSWKDRAYRLFNDYTICWF